MPPVKRNPASAATSISGNPLDDLSKLPKTRAMMPTAPFGVELLPDMGRLFGREVTQQAATPDSFDIMRDLIGQIMAGARRRKNGE